MLPDLVCRRTVRLGNKIYFLNTVFIKLLFCRCHQSGKYSVPPPVWVYYYGYLRMRTVGEKNKQLARKPFTLTVEKKAPEMPVWPVSGFKFDCRKSVVILPADMPQRHQLELLFRHKSGKCIDPGIFIFTLPNDHTSTSQSSRRSSINR